jgi:hypothetical protein
MLRRDLLKLGGAACLASSLPRARADTSAARRLVIVFASGAWDTTYALDPKEPTHVDVPAGKIQLFGGLDVFCDATRPRVTGFFAKYGALTAIVRGIGTDALDHLETRRRIATGTREETSPDVGAIVAHDLGAALPIPYLVLGDIAFAGAFSVIAARVGTTNQIVDLVGPGPGPSATETALLRRYAQASADRARATRGALGYNRRRVDDFVEALDRGDRLRALGGFGQRGVATSFDAQISIALDALAQDVSHAVMIDTRQAWDTHYDNFLQTPAHEVTFTGLTALIDGLVARPGRRAGTRMIDDTAVICISEMARGPRLTGLPPHQGKDHWPVTAALVIGAGVAGGRTFGATTPDMHAVAVDLATGAPSPAGTNAMYSHFVAGVLALCGIDPTSYLGVPAYDAFVTG